MNALFALARMGTRPTRPSSRLLGIALACAGALGCRQIIDSYVGVGSQPPPASADAGADVATSADAGVKACGLPQGSTSCAACAMANCCSEATACSGSQACDDYETCLAACPQGDPACRARCGIDHPTGTASGVSALSACLVTHCEKDCGLTCGALAGWAVEPDAAAAFQSCLASNECDPVRACAGSTDCDAVLRCIVACPPASDCWDTCMTSHGVDPAWVLSDAGETDATAIYAGVSRAFTACATAAGNYWECVGQVSWPPVHAATTMLQTRVSDSISGLTISGMEVALCGTKDIDCTSPWGIGHTDSAGLISIMATLPFGLPDTTFYLKVTSPTTSSTPTTPSYQYLPFPLTQDRVVLGRLGNGNVGTGVAFVTPAEQNSIVNQIRAGLDAGALDAAAADALGGLVVQVFDCLFSPAPGVLVTLTPTDPRTVAIALSNFAPSAPVTDSMGYVFFVNVPAGPVTITMTPPAIGKVSGTVGVTMRAGAAQPITLAVVLPTP